MIHNPGRLSFGLPSVLASAATAIETRPLDVAAGWADKFVVRVSDHLLEVKAANDAIWATPVCSQCLYSIPAHRGMQRTV